jgi:hypothetical protein
MTHARTIVAAAVAVTRAVSHGQVPRPVPTGPYAIGRQNIVWTDSTRRDPADTTQLRRINAWCGIPRRRRRSSDR